MMKYFSMFSGIGGFEKGIEQSGVDMECVGYSEIDKYAVSIYERQFPNHINWGDATEIDPTRLPDFDFLVGGFPCQAFSLAGKRKGFDDTRGTLFFEIARVLREKRPRYFLLENVKGLLSHDRGKTFQKILGVLAELGYDVEWEVLNSKNFGVPQNRERIFLKGYFRTECGGEILSQKRDSQEIIGEMSINWFHRGNHQNEHIICDDGLCSTITSTGGNSGNQTLIKQDIKLPVTKRKYDVDVEKLQNLLRESKENMNLSISVISKELDIPQTQVEHWFRTDKYFSIPPKDAWFKLKDVLGITTDEFDESITTFETVDGVYDMSNRCYDADGISPTITNDGNKLIQINNNKPHSMAERIYDSDGLSTTLRGCGGGQGGKTGLYKVELLNGTVDGNIGCLDANYHKGLSPSDIKQKRQKRTHIIESKDEPEIKKVGNVAANGTYGKGNVYSDEGISPSVLACNYKDNIKVLESESEIKKSYGSTQKHRAETDGSYSPTLTSAMGEGGGHVPMVETEDEPEFVRMHDSNQEHRMISEDTYCALNNHRTPMVEFDKPKIKKLNNNTQAQTIYDGEGISPTLSACDYKSPLKIRTDVEKGYVEADVNDGVRLDHPNSNTRRGTVQKESTGALSCGSDWGTVDKDFRIRRLTPKECERLQGFPDDWTKYGKDGELISDTQRYKCCGNAVTVNVIEFLIRSMFG